MFVRKALAGLVTVSLTGATLALTAGAAHADPNDTQQTPTEADIVGVGSDTSQNALFRLASGYNAKTPAPTAKLLTFAATGEAQITLHNGAIARPINSGQGKALLYGGTGGAGNPGVDYARSSSANSTAETQAGLQAFPFALDTLGVAVASTSNAPASLTRADILKIYKGEVTNWSQLGGQPGVIVPILPFDGSGTLSFFQGQLTAENGGTVPQYASSVQRAQENEPTPIQGNPNAIAPFSSGRAGLTGGAVKVLDGFRANRAIYNVVRGSDVGRTDITDIFGEDGYICSPEAQAAIVAAGFQQLATGEDGGVCGQPTQTATSNFTVSPAPADSDTDFAASLADVVGAGSDTSQTAVFLLAQAYNAGLTAGSPRLATFGATGSPQVQLPSGPIARPINSGQGKALLYGGTGGAGNTEVDFARSSSANSTAETQAGLQMFPFALDTLGVAVASTSNAPATLTRADILKIYKGEVTNWSQLGGQPGVIVPILPFDGSGTLSFFQGQLSAENGGTVPQYASSVQRAQENEPTPIQGNPNAIAPFSVGRAGLTNGVVKVLDGFRANRAIYNVVRGSDVGRTDITNIFGEEGFVCSDAATDEIVAAGFKQLARGEDDGVCGQPTQTATSNFAVNEDAQQVATTTTVTAVSATPRTLQLSATVAPASGTTAPTGTVQFANQSGPLGSPVTLTNGVASLDLTDVPAGAYTITATYTPATGAAFTTSTGTATVTVAEAPVATTTTVTAASPTPRSLRLAARVSGTPAPTGTVTFRANGTVLSTVTLSNGVASLARTVAPGRYAITATYTPAAGSAYTASTGSASVAVKTTSAITESFALTRTKRQATAPGVVTVGLAGTTAKATGKVTIKEGAKTVATGTLEAGKVSLTIARTKVGFGKSTLKISYPGSALAAASSKTFTITFKN